MGASTSLSTTTAKPDDFILESVPSADLALFWPVMEAHFDHACKRVATTLTAEIIKRNILDGHWMGWAIYERDQPVPVLAAAATSLRETNKGLTVVIEAVGGRKLSTWFHPVISEFERMAREHGVARIEVEGRRGWEQRLPGFHVTRVVMEKVL